MVSLCVESSTRILVGFQGVVERRRFLCCDTVEYFINLGWGRRLKRKWRFGGYLNKMYPYGAKEWKVDWINKTDGVLCSPDKIYLNVGIFSMSCRGF